VPLLLHMGEPQLALEKALASGDTELLHLVILHAKDNLPPEPFFALFSPPAAAQALPLLVANPNPNPDANPNPNPNLNQALPLLVGYAAARDAKLLKVRVTVRVRLGLG